MTLTSHDYENLRQLFARLAFNLDRGAGEEYAADYTADGSFEVLGIPDEAAHKGKHSGRSELVAFIDTLYSGTGGHVRHWNHNFVFTEETPSTATVTSYLQVLRVGEAPKAGVILTGIYTDTVVRTGNRWFLRTRIFQADPQDGAAEEPTDVLVVRRDRHVQGLARES